MVVTSIALGGWSWLALAEQPLRPLQPQLHWDVAPHPAPQNVAFHLGAGLSPQVSSRQMETFEKKVEGPGSEFDSQVEAAAEQVCLADAPRTSGHQRGLPP